MMKIFDENTIGNAAPIHEWVKATEQAFIDTANGELEVPPRMHIDRGQNTLLLMPCFGSAYFSTKLVSVFPKNLLKKESIKSVRIIDHSRKVMMRFASEIIITATGSHHPVVPDRGDWWKGKTIIGIGSYKPEMREFPDQIFSNRWA